MPSTSAKQHRFMEAIAHSSEFARKAGVPQSVGRDFATADDKAGITKHKSGPHVHGVAVHSGHDTHDPHEHGPFGH